MRYEFEHDEITCCADCPLFYDYINCEIWDGGEYGGYTWEDDEGRPTWCPLEERP